MRGAIIPSPDVLVYTLAKYAEEKQHPQSAAGPKYWAERHTSWLALPTSLQAIAISAVRAGS